MSDLDFVLPASLLITDDAYPNVEIRIGNTVANTNALTVREVWANGTNGNPNEILTSDGTYTYWAPPTAVFGVNTADRYTWTNNHTFVTNVFFGNSTVNATVNSTTFTGTANNSLNLGGTAANIYVKNTDSRTLSGNIVFSGANIYFTNITQHNAGIWRSTGNGPAYWLQQDGTGRSHWYWNTSGGSSPTYATAGEDVSSLSLSVTNSGAGGALFHRSASGVGKLVGDAVTWTTTLYVDLNNITWKGTAIAVANGSTYNLTANNASYLGGNTASDLRTYTDNRAANAYSNAISYSGNAAAAYSNAIAYSGNAAQAYANSVTYGNNTFLKLTGGTLTGNLILGTVGVSANSSYGTSGQVLTSNGSATYWSTITLTGGTVTSVGSGNGLTGGPITSSGTLSVLANSGLSTNSTGVFVVPGNGLVATNSTGVHVGAGNGVTVNSTAVAVLANTGLVANSTGLFVNSSYISTVTSSTANNASFLGGVAAASYVQNTDSRTMSGTLTFTATQIIDVSGNQLLLHGTGASHPTVIHRNDDVNYYILLSNSSTTANGTWNSLRPLFINLTSGLLTSQNGQSFSGGTMFSANVTLGSSGLSANGSFGTAGHVLHSNGTATYWAADDQGVTSVATGNGLTGGTITATGTVSVLANTGIIANTTGLFVNSSYIATLTANNATNAFGKTEGNLNVNSASTATTATNQNGGTVSATTGSFSGRVTASASQSVGSLLNASGSLGGIEITGGGGANAAFMAFHRPSAYAAYFGLDTDNNFAVGGWSAGAALGSMKVGSLGVGTAASGTAGEIRATNEITAFYSDARLKTDIQRITEASEKLKLISGVFYKNNDLAKSFGFAKEDRQVGVLAQDIQKALPEAVRHAPFDIDSDGSSKSGENYLTVKYELLVPLLIEALKEALERIEKLENK